MARACPQPRPSDRPVLIEVVIPAHDAAPFLREALCGIAAQTLRPDRVTVVDDASRDGTVAVARACAAELEDRIAIRVLSNAGPRGPSAARNTAIRASTAEWIALLDADDLPAPDHHATLLRVARSAPDVVLGFGNSTLFRDGADGRETEVADYLAVSGVAARPAQAIAPGCWTLGEDMFAALMKHGVFGTSACLFRREAALAAGLFDESMTRSEDTDFFLRLALRGRFAFTRGIVAHKRVHGGNLSHPRHRLAFHSATAFSLARLAAGAAPGPAQRAVLRAGLAEALETYLYHASRAGLPAYAAAAAMAWRAGQPLRAARPRHLARLLLHGWGAGLRGTT